MILFVNLESNLSRQNLIAIIDAAMADYPEFGEIKNERATSITGWNSETELADTICDKSGTVPQVQSLVFFL